MRVFTTGQTAKILQCSCRIVQEAFDRKELLGYVVGKRDRRIPEEDLRAFMIQRGIPTDRLDEGRQVTPEMHALEKRIERLERIFGIRVDVA